MTQNEMIALENAKYELLEALKPFAEAGRHIEWETSKDYYKFYPVNSMCAASPLTLGNIRQAMKVYDKYLKEE